MKSVQLRIIKGIKANLFGQSSTIAIQFLSVPLLVGCWGAETYGVWVTLNAIPTYLAISDLGFGSAAANEMAMDLAKQNRAKASETFQTVWTFSVVVSFLISALSIYCIFALPVNLWFNTTQSLTEFRLTALILVFYSVNLLQSNVLHAGFKCNGFYPLVTTITSIIRLIEWCFVFIVIILDADILGAVATMSVIRFGGTLYLYYLLGETNPWLTIGFSKFNLATLKRLSVPAFTFLGLPLGNAINNQGMLIVIASHVGPTAVASFATLRTLCRFSFQFMNTIRFSSWPEISRAYGEGDIRLTRLLYERCCRFSFWIVLLLVVGLSIFGKSLFEIWTKGELPFNSTIFYLMLALMITNTLWFSSSVVHTATNNHSGMTLLYVCLVSASVCSTILFIGEYGEISAVASLLVVDIAMIVYVFYRSSRILGESIRKIIVANFQLPSIKELKKIV